MHTYFIGKEEVKAYAKDLLGRFNRLQTFPNAWCPVTNSGDVIQEALIAEMKERQDPRLADIESVPIDAVKDKESKTVSVGFPEESDPDRKLRGKSVLLIDGAIHSGKTMHLCAAAILKHGPQELITYSLIMKVRSAFVPTFWGVAIDELDRAFFELGTIPNHRLDAGHIRPQAPVHFERLSERHVGEDLLETDIKSMDRVTWSDRLFQMQTSESPPCTYLLMRRDSIVGYLTIHHVSSDVFSIDEIAVEKSHRGSGYAGILLRFADTLARQTNSKVIQLLGFESKVDMYRDSFGYRTIGKETIKLDDEVYIPMQREILYHQRPR